jgi:hypothetical protein
MARDIDRRTMYEIIDEPGLNIDKIEANLKKEAAEGIAGQPPRKMPKAMAGGPAK